MESLIVTKGDGHASGRVEAKPNVSLRHELRAVEVLARALLKRIESLRSAGSEVVNLADEVEHFEAELISSALIETAGRQRRAAHLLGMNITTLNRKLKRYNIKPAKTNAFDRMEPEVEHLS